MEKKMNSIEIAHEAAIAMKEWAMAWVALHNDIKHEKMLHDDCVRKVQMVPDRENCGDFFVSDAMIKAIEKEMK